MNDELNRKSSGRRTTVVLLFALMALLLLLVAIGYFYLSVIGVSTEVDVEVVSEDFSATVLDSYYGAGAGTDGPFFRPHDVSMGPDGDVYVADTGNGRIVRLTQGGSEVARFGTMEWGPGKLDMPNGVAVGPDGRVYVADGGVHGPHGKLMILSPDMSAPEFEVMFPPEDPPITPRVIGDRLYVTSRGRVSVYTLDGELVSSFGTFGTEEGEFRYPNGVALMPDGRIAVAEAHNARVQFFDERGTFLGSSGRPRESMTENAGLFQLPMGIAVDEYGLIYMADAFEYAIRILDTDGGPIGRIGDKGSADGEFDAPGGITYSGDGVFLIADELNHRVVRMQVTPSEVILASLEASAGLAPNINEKSVVGTGCLWSVPVLLFVLGVILVTVRRRRVRAEDLDAEESPADSQISR